MPIFNTYIGDAPEPPAAERAAVADDQRLRRNIQWGVVRGMLLYSLFMVPVVFVAALLISALK